MKTKSMIPFRECTSEGVPWLKSQNSTFTNQGELVQNLVQSMGENGESKSDSILILGGHFLLMYSIESQSLVPMILDENKSEIDRNLITRVVGSFPTDSMKLAAKIATNVTLATTKIAILVNDHQFARFQVEVERKDIGKLRKRFYRSRAEIPAVFQEILQAHNLPVDRFILRNDKPPRVGRGILPRKTPFFSEQNLRNIFRSRTLPQLASFPLFCTTITESGAKQLLWAGNKNNIVPLSSEDGQCGCSGEVVQLLREFAEISDLIMPAKKTLVLIVPSECSQPVCIGAAAAMEVFCELTSVHVVWGLEGNHTLQLKTIAR